MEPRHRADLLFSLARCDERGWFHPGEVKALRRLVATLQERGAPLDHPKEVFGPWERLGTRAQEALRGTIEGEIRGVMDLFPQGDIWNGLIRGARELERFIADTGSLEALRPHVAKAADRLSFGPLDLRNKLLHRSRSRRWLAGVKSGPAAFLDALGRGPQWLLGDFAQGVHVDPRARGYYYDPHRHVCYGYHVGLDLLPTSDGIGLLAAGLQSPLRGPPEGLDPGVSQVVSGLVEGAAREGFRSLIWVEGDQFHLPTGIMEDLVPLGAAAGIRVEIMEDPRLPRRKRFPAGGWLPNRRSWVESPRDDSLIIRRNEFPVGTDFFMSDKEALRRGLSAVLAEEGVECVRILPAMRPPQKHPELRAEIFISPLGTWYLDSTNAEGNPAIEAAAMAFGNALRIVIERTFVTRPTARIPR